ncbi:hypothetical protein lbkm_3374 [Lachnospiraceae bacterium KM106-2]|nr:hypothetical protein lbkm_3374 [Lachnospiraceae bacterium KM106-2]
MKQKQLQRYIALLLSIVLCILSLNSCDFSKKTNTTPQNTKSSNESEKSDSHNDIYKELKSPTTNDTYKIQAHFDLFTDEIFYEYAKTNSLTLKSTLAYPENFGIEHYTPTLGTFSTSYLKEANELNLLYLRILNTYDPNKLSDEQKLTYTILKEKLSLSKNAKSMLCFAEPLQAISGAQSVFPILLAEYKLSSEKDIKNYLALLPCVYEYFSDVCKYEKEKSASGYFMPDYAVDDLISQCKQFIKNPEKNYLIETFNTRITTCNLSKERATQWQEKNVVYVKQYVIPAYNLLIKTLSSLKGTGKNKEGLSHYKNGKAYYEYLVKDTTGSAKTVKELDAWLDETIKNSLNSILTISVQDENAFNNANKVTYPYSKPNDILNYLKDNISNDFPKLSGISCKIKAVHKSLEEYSSPAFYLTPPIDNYTTNTIYINNGSEQTTNNMFTSLAHEGYPGHLYQTVYYEKQNASLVRYALDFLGYSEGWATYVELYSYDLAKLNTNVASILKHNFISTLCLYAKVDIGIHYYGWSLEDTKKYLSTYGIEDENDITYMYHLIVEEPANYLAYTIGYLEINGLREKAVKQLGNKYTNKAFHEFLLKIGPAQFNIIDQYLDDWIAGETQ